MTEPKCPVCGRKMKLNSYPVKGMYGAKYRCCEWSSPARMGGTREEAERHARIAALKRKLKKPLTLDEVRHHCEMPYASPVWLETREAAFWIYANVNDDEMIKGALATIKDDWLTSNMVYGVRWRCWRSRPTDEERAAAEWEDK